MAAPAAGGGTMGETGLMPFSKAALIQPEYTTQSYEVSLTVTNSCGSSTVTKTIENLGNPSVNFNPANASICEDAPADLLIDFNTTYKPNYSKGVFAPKSYEWIISGTDVTASDYAFTGGTNASSAFPKIIFKAYKTFAINVKVNGECNGNNEATFNLTLKETPVITNSNLTQSICSGTSTSAIPWTSIVTGKQIGRAHV